MGTTFILELNPDLLGFVYGQPEFSDPSMLVNYLLREEKKRKGVKTVAGDASVYQEEVHVAMEDFLDENTPAAD